MLRHINYNDCCIHLHCMCGISFYFYGRRHSFVQSSHIIQLKGFLLHDHTYPPTPSSHPTPPRDQTVILALNCDFSTWFQINHQHAGGELFFSLFKNFFATRPILPINQSITCCWLNGRRRDENAKHKLCHNMQSGFLLTLSAMP